MIMRPGKQLSRSYSKCLNSLQPCSGFLRYDTLSIQYHCKLLYSPSSIIYPVDSTVLNIPRSTSKVDFVILKTYNIPYIYLVKFQTQHFASKYYLVINRT